MEITIKELKDKIILLNSIDQSINDKLTYGVKKISDRITKATKQANDKLNENLSDIRIDLCDKDENGLILFDENNNYTFKNADNLKKLNSRGKDLISVYEDITITIEPYIVVSDNNCTRIKDLDLFLVEELTGLLF